MPDTVDHATRSWIMARVPSTGSKPEMAVRRAVHAAGFRYRLHPKHLPGRPDLVFPRLKLAVFVHGCQWHWHGCKRSRMPATNREYWERKIARNVARDQEARAALEALGWRWFVAWECELRSSIPHLLAMLDGECRPADATTPEAQ
ncbi:MAG TPA: very short patch repair endonuclease [Methylomirabilota bacterium]|nr:very short patch repair endonuclease [Methylomirabilota bacterium]